MLSQEGETSSIHPNTRHTKSYQTKCNLHLTKQMLLAITLWMLQIFNVL